MWQTYSCSCHDGNEIGIGLYEGEDSVIDLAWTHRFQAGEEAACDAALLRLEDICAKLNKE